MIVPTPEYDPMFADDGVPFRTKMIQYIKQEFSDLLGPRVGLLETDDGLDLLSSLHSQTAIGMPPVRKAA
jgi:hypothetical protein